MNNNIYHITALYEIALHIGNEKELEPTIKEAVEAFMLHLDLAGAFVVHKNFEEKFETIFARPKNLLKKESYKKVFDVIKGDFEEINREFFEKETPYFIKIDNDFFHFAKINDDYFIGFLRSSEYEVSIAKSLNPLYKKLAQAIHAAQESKRLEENKELLNQQSRLASMGEMISNISHQWRQPLSVLSMSVQMLEVQPLKTDKEVEKFIEGCLEQINYLSDTIDDFRNFYKEGESNKEFYALDVVESAKSIVHSSLTSIYIDLNIDCRNNFLIFGNKNKLAQVIINILNNARDAIKLNGIENPKVSIIIDEIDGSKFIKIVDNGGGIPDKVLPKIFDPYYTTKFKNQGTGIGLYMSKIIVEQQMKGTLSASNVDNGAEFTIEF